MKVFLTGATGFIGQALVRAMRRRDWQVTALVRDPESEPSHWLTKRGVALVAGDVTRRQGLRDAMAGADVALHNAGVYELGANQALVDRMQAVNVQGTDNVLGAALEAGIERTLYVSTAWVLGPSGYLPQPSASRDESQRHSGQYLTPYERSKAEAHEVALAYREKGLPLVIAMPNGVVGANDHSAFGYYLRMHLLGVMTPVGFGRDAVLSLVDVDALAEGLCLAAEKAAVGQDYLFCGDPMSIGDVFTHFNRSPGGMRPRWWLPRWFMRPWMALSEPLLRAMGLPAFFSRDVVDVTKVHMNYSSDKARLNLGWTHPDPNEMWQRIIARERELVFKRKGLLNRLRHQGVIPD